MAKTVELSVGVTSAALALLDDLALEVAGNKGLPEKFSARYERTAKQLATALKDDPHKSNSNATSAREAVNAICENCWASWGDYPTS